MSKKEINLSKMCKKTSNAFMVLVLALCAAAIANLVPENKLKLISSVNAEPPPRTKTWGQLFNDPFLIDPLREISFHRHRMQQLFRQFDNQVTRNKNFYDAPKFNFQQTDRSYLIKAAVPGLEKDQISVELENNLLTILGEKKTEEKKDKQSFYSNSYSAFRRILKLPEDIEENKIEAEYKNGILSIEIPRKQALNNKKKKILIQ